MKIQRVTGCGEISVFADDGMPRNGISCEVGNFIPVQFNSYTVQARKVDDVADLGEIEKDILFNANAEMLADEFAPGFRAEVIINIINAALILFFVGSSGVQDRRIADNGSQHNPVSRGVEG